MLIEFDAVSTEIHTWSYFCYPVQFPALLAFEDIVSVMHYLVLLYYLVNKKCGCNSGSFSCPSIILSNCISALIVGTAIA